MEELTKTQIILLSLLLSFVTSIGTGIITVSLLNVAPPNVTQTINRVVERTVEKVVPSQNSNTVTKETTVVVKEEDLIVDSIKKNAKSIVRVNGPSLEDGNNFYGLGLVVSKEGTLIVSKKNISLAGSYVATFPDGKKYPLGIPTVSDKSDFAFFKTLPDPKDNYVFYPVQFTDSSDSLQLGQTAIALGGKEKNTVTIGRISGLMTKDDDSKKDIKIVTLIETDMNLKDVFGASPLISLSGQVIGLKAPESETVKSGSYIPSNAIKKEITDFLASSQNR
jgi:S1-C subfamily serine protease